MIKVLFFSIFFVFSFASEYVIKFSYVVSPDTPKGKAVEYFAKRVKELSRGKIEVKIYPNSILGSDTVVLRKVRFNSVQMAAPSFAKFSKLVPQFGLFDLPFLFKNEKHFHKVVDGEIGEKLKELLKAKGYIVLGYWDNGFKEITNSKRVIRKPSDCKGLKFRIMNSKVLLEQYKVLGAIPIILPFSEVYSALQQGIVDGEENTISNIYTKKFYEVQKYMTITNHGYLGYVVVISRIFWEKLPLKMQKILLQAMKEATLKEREWAKKLNSLYLQKIKNTSIKIYYLTNEERKLWFNRLKTIYPKFYNLLGKDLINKVIFLSK